MTTARWPLFVFGTLRRGEPNHGCLAERYDHCQPATLCGFSKRHPLMIVPDPAGVVSGELFDLTPHRYEEALALCDELEEIPPGQLRGSEYQRVQVLVDTAAGERRAWAYVHAGFDIPPPP